VQWNVDRPVRRLDGDLRWLAAQDADLITIAERHPRNKNTLDRWQAALPDYQLLPSDGEMLCLVRGEILSSEEGSLGYGSYRTLIHARIRGHEMTVLQVDINGYPSESRRPPLQTLAALVAQHRSECLIVLGDFNTPKDSAFFLPLRALAVNAFETAGRGCADTWPMPLPVLSLDQMWTTGQLRPVRCEHMISWRSDHRAVRAEFDFAP
jgi:endonuclease/exonuclease/phosphatase (EEP) superfamily protein YafD